MIQEKPDKPNQRIDYNTEATNSNYSQKPNSVKNIISE